RLGTWLHRVTVNAALMRIRSRARRHEESAESAAFDEAASRESGEVPAANPSDALSRAEMRQRVRLAIARLPEIYRTVLMLRDIEGIELKEIGVLLGIGLSTVKIRLHRGRHVLRQLLAAARQVREGRLAPPLRPRPRRRRLRAAGELVPRAAKARAHVVARALGGRRDAPALGLRPPAEGLDLLAGPARRVLDVAQHLGRD